MKELYYGQSIVQRFMEPYLDMPCPLALKRLTLRGLIAYAYADGRDYSVMWTAEQLRRIGFTPAERDVYFSVALAPVGDLIDHHELTVHPMVPAIVRYFRYKKKA